MRGREQGERREREGRRRRRKKKKKMENRKEKRKREKTEREREREGEIRAGADRGVDRGCTRTRVGRAWRGGRWFVTCGTGKREGRDRDWT